MKIIAGLEPNDMRVINVEIPAVDKIAVVFSGGMDSTLLTYMLIQDKEQRQLDTEIHCFTATKCGTMKHSANVMSLPEFAGKVIHHNDVPNDGAENVKSVIRDLLNDGWTVFAGTNQVPLEQIGGRYPPRPAQNPENPKGNLPFLFLFKYHILDSYFKLGIDHLLPITHTCTEQFDGECGLCYACRERHWAFNKLNKEIK